MIDDPDEVMAEHYEAHHPEYPDVHYCMGGHRGWSVGWPCQKYRLAERVKSAEIKLTQVLAGPCWRHQTRGDWCSGHNLPWLHAGNDYKNNTQEDK
jgi:hypothetical protein